MKTKNMGKWSFHYENNMIAIKDNQAQKIIFLPSEYDDIHLIVEVINNKLTFQPRWNVQFMEISENEFDVMTTK